MTLKKTKKLVPHVNKHQVFPGLMVEEEMHHTKNDRRGFWLWRAESLLTDWFVNFLSPSAGFLP